MQQVLDKMAQRDKQANQTRNKIKEIEQTLKTQTNQIAGLMKLSRRVDELHTKQKQHSLDISSNHIVHSDQIAHLDHGIKKTDDNVKRAFTRCAELDDFMRK
jgi:tRNA A-37 threonylcarbamoyl transferase component Bud32